MKSHVMLVVSSRMCQFTALALCAPLLVGIYYEEEVWRYYGGVALGAIAIGMLLRLFALHDTPSALRITRREGFAAVVVSWLTLVFFGALPFWLSGAVPTLADAVFESASGFSTTGATILTNIDTFPHAHLFQRSLSHWIGGMGIIVLSVAILPELAVGGMQLFSAESSGIDTDKLSPRIVSTARRLWQVYVAMTVVLVVLLLAGHMSVFDAVTHAFGTVATGGFSTHSASIAAFDSLYIESVTVVFMLAAGMSFALLFRLIIRRQAGPLLRSEEVRLYLGVFALFAAAITANLVLTGTYPDVFTAARVAVFQTATIITTTGFGTANFDVWPDLSRYLLVLLMVMGGCAGSTAGGIKAIRLLLVYRHAIVELKKLMHPSLV
ncbi:MAG: TrkH family potassium uptake protein, partial [Candidatus Binatia bacterium]